MENKNELENRNSFLLIISYELQKLFSNVPEIHYTANHSSKFVQKKIRELKAKVSRRFILSPGYFEYV